MVANFIAKARRKIRHRLSWRLRHSPPYPWFYPATWHGLRRRPVPGGAPPHLTAIPNPGAGIGHQVANWIAGHHFAERFGCVHVHTPFSDPAWDALLNFGMGQPSAAAEKADRRRIATLPLFDEDAAADTARIGRTIASYAGRKVLLRLENDQFHRAQHGALRAVKPRYDASAARRAIPLRFDPLACNIAVHVRRGDVSREAAEANANLRMRWQEVDYFERVLDRALARLPDRSRARIYLFSQGTAAEFASFGHHPHVTLCLDMGPMETFVHLSSADLLIASKSGFSYTAAMLGDGVAIVPANFWHDYPDDPRIVRAGDDGGFDAAALDAALEQGTARPAAAPDGPSTR